MGEALITRRGGGVKFAEGSQARTTENTLVVTGLGFKPSSVMICRMDASNYANSTSAVFMKDGIVYSHVTSGADVGEYCFTGYSTIDMNADGFTVTAKSTKPLASKGEYYWVAIG